jgi:hypothetical protein
MVMTFKDWRNKSGTTDRDCRCGSWSQHWLNFSNTAWPGTCSVLGCKTWPGHGGHVYSNSDPNRHEFIVPLCAQHNGSDESFGLKLDREPVSANQRKTCEPD